MVIVVHVFNVCHFYGTVNLYIFHNLSAGLVEGYFLFHLEDTFGGCRGGGGASLERVSLHVLFSNLHLRTPSCL